MGDRYWQHVVMQDTSFLGTVEASTMLVAAEVLSEDPATPGHENRAATARALFMGNPADLTPTQQAALDACGGPASCTVAVSTTVNIQSPATLQGFEGIWVQPLDFLLPGLGFNASATTIEQDAADPAAIITGISDWTYNWTGYYENDLFSARITYFHQDGAVASGFQGGWDGSGGAPARRIKSDDRSQVYFATSLYLPFLSDYGVAVTFDGYNITNEPVRSLFEHPNLTNDIYYPGATYTLGLRGSF